MIPLLVSACNIQGFFSVRPLEPIERKTSMQLLTDLCDEVLAQPKKQMKVTQHATDWNHDPSDYSLMEHGSVAKRATLILTLQSKAGPQPQPKRAPAGPAPAVVIPPAMFALQDMVAGATAHEDDVHAGVQHGVGDDVKNAIDEDIDNDVKDALRKMDDKTTDVATASSLATDLHNESARDAALAQDGSSNPTYLPSDYNDIVDKWISAALKSLRILEAAFDEVDGCTRPEDYGGGRHGLNNVSLLFTPGLQPHFLHWVDRTAQRGQRVGVDNAGCIKCVVNFQEKAKCWAVAVTGSIMIKPNVGVPMMKFRGVRHPVPKDVVELQSIWTHAVAPAEVASFSPCALCCAGAINQTCFLCKLSWHTQCSRKIVPRVVDEQFRKRIHWPRPLLESKSLCCACQRLVDLNSGVIDHFA